MIGGVSSCWLPSPMGLFDYCFFDYSYGRRLLKGLNAVVLSKFDADPMSRVDELRDR